MKLIWLLAFLSILAPREVLGKSKKVSKKKNKAKKSRVAIDIGIMSPEGIPFSLKLRPYKNHWIRFYAAPPISFEKESVLDERQVLDISEVVSIKNTEGVLPTDVTYGPHYGFDYIVPIKRKWSFFVGAAYRKVTVEGNSASPVQIEVLGRETPSLVQANIQTKAQYEQYGLRGGVNYELYSFSRNFKLNFTGGLWVPVHTNESYNPSIQVKEKLLGTDITSVASSNLGEQREFIQGRTEDEMSILKYPLPILGISTEYRF